jgi:hypothetical protein
MRELSKYTNQKVGQQNSHSTQYFLVNTNKEEIIKTYYHIIRQNLWLNANVRGLSDYDIKQNDIKINDYNIISKNNLYKKIKIGQLSTYCLIATEQTKDFGLCAYIRVYRYKMTTQIDVQRGYVLPRIFELLEQMFTDRKRIAHYMIFQDRFQKLIREAILRRLSVNVSIVYEPVYYANTNLFYLQLKDIFNIEDLDVFVYCNPKNLRNKTLKLKYTDWQYNKTLPHTCCTNQVTDESIMKLIQINKKSLINLFSKKDKSSDKLITIYALFCQNAE